MRKTDRRRWERSILHHLDDLPRQIAALEHAMATFGRDFDQPDFKRAYETTEDMEAYNRVQAVERGAGRVQNYVAELAESGVKLADLRFPPRADDGSRAQQAFEAIRDEGVITGSLCRRQVTAQRARSRIEHSYVSVPAGDVHRATVLVHSAALEFIDPYARWIAPYLAAP